MSTQPPVPPPPSAPASKESEGLTEGQLRAIVVVVILVIAGLLAVAVLAANRLLGDPASAATWRDIFIIFMAVESLFIGAALIVLIVQLAILMNMLRHEIKPILEATNET